MEGSSVAADENGERILQQTGWHERTLEEELTKKQDEFAGLLTRNDALALIAREKGVAPKQREEKAATALAEVKPGEEISARARVWHVFATKHFSKKTPFGERTGKVRNMLVKDATGEATIVLWGKDAEWPQTVGLHRNSIVELFGAASKLGTRGMELHSSLTTRLSLSPKEEGSLPSCPAKILSPEELSQGQMDVDIKGVISKVGRKSEFTRVKKTGETERSQVFDCWLACQGKQVRLVAWDSNALSLQGVAEGDSVTLEGGSVKSARDGNGLEVHAGWASHILVEKGAANAVSATSTQTLSKTVSNALEKTQIGELQNASEGASFSVIASVKAVSNAWSLQKCASCGAKMPLKAGAESTCSCGGKFSKLFVVRATLEDATGEVETAFFNEQALSLLGLNSIPLDGSAIIDLKKDEAAGKKFSLQLKLKKSQFSKQMEATASSLTAAS